MTTFPEGEFLLPLFPLPNLVFFPRTRLPLHVFEPRYRQMITDAVAADQRFGIVLLRPGWEADYFGAPPIYACGTVGQIEQAVPLEDGRYNVLVRGEVRFRVVGEVSREPYRTARVVIQPEQSRDVTKAYEQKSWLADLSRQYLHYLPDQVAVPEIDTVELEALTNALIMSLNIDVQEKQRLLEIDDLIARSEQVGNELQTRIESLQFLAPYRRQGGDPGQN
ncbi:MAG TPA: LON peptidase substrate-binding domain-containing protein [Thermoanaerobaculia bacterium]|nr:LON peptidase substrate-binding domain-containing protein [Thermoanaerobaculia bacterium]